MAASDDKLYAIGGGDGDVAALPTLFEYDPDLDSWSTKTPMPGGARIFSAAVVLRGKLYVVGGSDSDSKPVSTVEMYNPDTDSWTSLPDYPSADGKGAYQHITGATVDGEIIFRGESHSRRHVCEQLNVAPHLSDSDSEFQLRLPGA